MGIHEVGNHFSIDCISGDGLTMELELKPHREIDGVEVRVSGVEGVIVVYDGERNMRGILELDQERIDRLRAFLRGETHEIHRACGCANHAVGDARIGARDDSPHLANGG